MFRIGLGFGIAATLTWVVEKPMEMACRPDGLSVERIANWLGAWVVSGRYRYNKGWG